MNSERIIEAIIKRCPKKNKDNRPNSQQQWCLFDSKGKRLLGRHPSKEKALAQERAIQVHKHGSLKIAEEVVENYTGETSFNFGHSHEYKTDDFGNGLTSKVNKHVHTVTEFNVQRSSDGHRHLIRFEDAKHERRKI